MRRALRASLTVYVALLVAPAVTLLPAPTWPAFGVGALLAGAVALPATARLAAPDALASLPRAIAGFVLPLGWLWPAATSPTSVVTPWFVGALAFVPWFAAVVFAGVWRKRERLDRLSERVVFQARQPPNQRRQHRVAAVVVLVLAGAAMAVGFALGLEGSLTTMGWLVPAMAAIWIPLLASANEREVAVTDEGLRVDSRIDDWETVEGYELTDDALVFRRRGWHRGALSFDRTDVDDLDAVTAALDERLGPA